MRGWQKKVKVVDAALRTCCWRMFGVSTSQNFTTVLSSPPHRIRRKHNGELFSTSLVCHWTSFGMRGLRVCIKKDSNFIWVVLIRQHSCFECGNECRVMFLSNASNETQVAQFSTLYCLRYLGARGSAAGWGTALQTGRSRVWFPMVSLEFFIDIILPAVLWPWGRLSR
jgi:hypothetical protein